MLTLPCNSRRARWSTCAAAWLAVSATAAMAAVGDANFPVTDVPRALGGGNIAASGKLTMAEQQFTVLEALGAGICRIPVPESIYFPPKEKRPLPERCDDVILLARRYGVTPIFLFEYYTRWNGPLGGHDRWHAIGKAFAERFAPDSAFLTAKGVRGWGVQVYTAINEPTWKSNNPEPIVPDAYAAALEGLADGVHAVDPVLCVSPGGYIEGSLHGGRNPYAKAAAPLFNRGKLWSLDIHRYWDVKYVPMAGTYKHSLQNQFDEVKRDYGITADIRFHTTEMNFKKREITEDEAAKGFLTALWDALCVVGNQGQRVTAFVMPWNIFHTAEKDDHYGLCTQLDPWTPATRGKVLAMVCRLTRGMKFVSCDPKGRGVAVLQGGARKLWVWHNRKGWTNCPASGFRIADIPATAERLDVYGWEGLRRTVKLSGQDAVTVNNLETGQTYMFAAEASGEARP